MRFFNTKFIKIMTIMILGSFTYAHPRTKEHRGTAEVVASKNGIIAEPSCEELKAMWRFSKRQSRAAEITNEIPMYRDPFSSNVWDSYYPSSRSLGRQSIDKYRNNRPVYGVLVHNPPYFRMQDKMARNKAFTGVTRWYHSPVKSDPSRKMETIRMSGKGIRNAVAENRGKTSAVRAPPIASLGFPPQQGSFQHLKELVKTERAQELQQQRATEEAVARAAALKDLFRDSSKSRAGFYPPYDFSTVDEDYGTSSVIKSDNQRPVGIISYLDMLSPSAHPMGHILRFVPDHVNSRNLGRYKLHRGRSYDSPSRFQVDYSGYYP